MKIKINGQDWTEYINPYSVRPSHEKRQGKNAGKSMGGSEIIDTVKVASSFSCMVGLIMQEQYAELMRLAKLDYVTVIYDDPDTGKEETRVMMLTTGKPLQLPLMGGGYAYKNISLDFEER